MLVILNMTDEAEKAGILVDIAKLSTILGLESYLLLPSRERIRKHHPGTLTSAGYLRERSLRSPYRCCCTEPENHPPLEWIDAVQALLGMPGS